MGSSSLAEACICEEDTRNLPADLGDGNGDGDDLAALDARMATASMKILTSYSMPWHSTEAACCLVSVTVAWDLALVSLHLVRGSYMAF